MKMVKTEKGRKLKDKNKENEENDGPVLYE
jgi:hypothetical protein